MIYDGGSVVFDIVNTFMNNEFLYIPSTKIMQPHLPKLLSTKINAYQESVYRHYSDISLIDVFR